MKRFITFLCLVVAMMAVTLGHGSAEEATCRPLASQDKRVEDALSRLYSYDILRGQPGSIDSPQQALTRAEFAVVVVNAMGRREEAKLWKGEAPYKDLAANHWAAGSVVILQQEGVIRGYPDGTFHPDDEISLGHVKIILARLLHLGSDLTAQTADEALRKSGVDTNVLCEDGKATLGQIAVLLDRAMSVTLYRRFQ